MPDPNFVDMSGQPRSPEEIREVLEWCKKTLVKRGGDIDISITGFLHLPVIIECLESYLRVVEHMDSTGAGRVR